MKTSPYRVRAFACALLATTATCGLIAQPAQAQTPGSGPPLPATVAPDAAGIDLLNGRRVGVDSAISIGSPDAPALEFSEGGGGFDGTPIAGFRYLRGNYPYLSEEYYLGNRQEYNRALGAPLSNGAITGVEGTNPVVYDKDGSKWKFAPTGNSQSDYPDYYLVSITRADGEVLSYNYASIPLLGDIRNKLRSIVSSSGFEMRFEWGAAGPAKVTLLNRKLVHCAPLATSCSGGGHNWPTIAWSQDTSGSVSATTSGARTITYGVKQQGAAVETTNQFTTWEWHSTITSGSGVTRTYTTRSDSAEESTPIYYGPTFFRLGYCNVASRVWRVQSPAGTWNYNYTLADNANTCADIVRTNPDGAQASRIGSTFYDELGRARTYVFRGTPGENGRAKDIRTVSSITQPEGDKASFVYDDEYGRLNLQSATLTPKPTLGAPTLTWAWSYPASCTGPQMVYCNKPSYELDAKGNRTDYTYDPVHGGVLTKTLPAGSNGVRPQIRYTYQQLSAKVLNASGQLVEEAPIWKLVSTSQCRTQASCQGTADEVVTSYTYNDLLLPETETVRGGDWSVSSVVRKTYDAVGNIVAVDGPLAGTGDTTRYVYDALRRLVATMSPDPDGGGPLPVRVMRTTYNSDGQPTSVETGTAIDQSDAALAAMTVYRQIGTAYDAAGRKVRETVSAGGITQAITHYSYDNVGRLQCTAVRMDLADANALTLPACTPDLSPSTSFGPDRITKNSYDAAGQLIKVTEAYGTPDQADEVTNSYTPNGKLETLADGENNKTTYEYDGHDRLAKLRFPEPWKGALASSTTDYEQYGYDANGNRTSFRNRAGETIGFSFDALNRMTFKDLPGTEPDVSYEYNLMGWMKSAQQPGHSVTFTYDALGRKLTEAGPHGTVSSQYDSGGRRTRLTYPDGYIAAFTWLDTGEMKLVQQLGPFGFGTPTTLITFGYDDLGRRSSITRANGATTSYSYDPVSRLSQLSHDPARTANDLTLGFSYNPASQITSNTRSNDVYAWTGHGNGTLSSPANGLNQLTSHNGGTVGHDAKGNITYDPTTGYTHGYSSENLLTNVSGSGWAGTLTYDPLMRLYDAGAGGRTRFLYDGATRIAEYSSNGSQVRRVVHGPGVDEPLIEYSGSGLGTRRFLHADERGSIIAASDDAGNATAVGRYDEDGRTQSFAGRFGYAGKPYETLTELYYSRARMYNPRLGPRFMQPDPAGYEDGPNLYGYVGGDPVNGIDPTGQACVAANGWSGYCRRAVLYSRLDTRFAAETRFFAAAAETATMLANLSMPGLSQALVSASTRQFMSRLSGSLEAMNMRMAKGLESGALRGGNLDRRFIHAEQTAVQRQLDSFRASNPKEYAKVIGEINGFLNPSGVPGAMGNFVSSDRAYQNILNGVRDNLGGRIDFANQIHREAIGNALVQIIRSVDGCNITGSRMRSC